MTRVWGITEMPPGERPHYYPDMLSEKLTGAIEAQGGRYAWTRATHCACSSINDNETWQSDPNCAVCKGKGIYYFGPANYVAAEAVGELDAVQQAIVAVDGAAVIRGVSGRFQRGATHSEQMFELLGRWRRGEAILTVRPENRLGHMDRLVALDAVICHDEVVDLVAGQTTIPTRYKVVDVNLAFTIVNNAAVHYTEGVEFTLDAGVVSWRAAYVPPAARRVVIHYLMHPTYRVMDMPHSTREISRRFLRPNPGPDTPHGTPVDLPIAAHIHLEHVPVEG